MNSLRPTLWRTCRALANPTRLTLLRNLLSGKVEPVCELAARTGISEQSASTHLRALASRGLLKATQQNRWVYYSAEANESVDNASHILETLSTCFQNGMSNDDVIRITTAFTHPRRIAIVTLLNKNPMTFDELMVKGSISAMALFRHLKKLEKRGFIRQRDHHFELAPPNTLLGMLLMQIATQSGTEI